MLIHEVLPEMLAPEFLNPGLVSGYNKFLMPIDPAGKSELQLVFPNHDLAIDPHGRPLVAYRYERPFGDVMLEDCLCGSLGMMQFEMMSGLFHQGEYPAFIMASSRQVHSDLIAGYSDIADTPNDRLHKDLAVVVRWRPGCRPANFGIDNIKALLTHVFKTSLYDILWYEYVAPSVSSMRSPSVVPSPEEQEVDIFVVEYRRELYYYFDVLDAMYKKTVSQGLDAWALYATQKPKARELVEREILAHLRPEIRFELREDDYLIWLPDGRRRWLRYDAQTVYQDRTYLSLDGVM